MDLADQGGDDVRRARIEVVARPVEIDRQQKNAVEAVLRPVRLRLDQQHLLGQPVGRVRLLRVAIPEVVFLEWHRGELRIGADGAHADELVDAGEPRLFHQLGAHHQVLEKERSRVIAIEADAAHLGGHMDDDIHALDGTPAVVAIHQVERFRPGHDDVGGPLRPQLGDDAGSQKTGAARHEDPAP